MRIWDLSPRCLCRDHLLGEHRELHAIWNVILLDKKGYSRHPEVVRWRGRLGALWLRHEEEVVEMQARGYSHRSPLDLHAASPCHGTQSQPVLVEPVAEQIRKLRLKGCDCNVQ